MTMSQPVSDDVIERLINMTNQTALLALDKTLYAIRNVEISSCAAAAKRTGALAETVVCSAHEVGLFLSSVELP